MLAMLWIYKFEFWIFYVCWTFLHRCFWWSVHRRLWISSAEWWYDGGHVLCISIRNECEKAWVIMLEIVLQSRMWDWESNYKKRKKYRGAFYEWLWLNKIDFVFLFHLGTFIILYIILFQVNTNTSASASNSSSSTECMLVVHILHNPVVTFSHCH